MSHIYTGSQLQRSNSLAPLKFWHFFIFHLFLPSQTYGFPLLIYSLPYLIFSSLSPESTVKNSSQRCSFRKIGMLLDR